MSALVREPISGRYNRSPAGRDNGAAKSSENFGMFAENVIASPADLEYAVVVTLFQSLDFNPGADNG